jgi:hypothetical protein
MLDATPILRQYARFRSRRLAKQNPVQTQQAQLLRLVDRASTTRFGRDHGFSAIRSVADYQSRVPLRNYEAFWADYWRAAFPYLQNVSWPGVIPYFAVTSGTTTGITKHIPCSHDIVHSNRRATLDLLTHHLAARPRSRIFGGLNFMLGGSTTLTEVATNVWAGDLSGIMGREVPGWARPFYFPPRDLETIADWEEKIAAFAPASLNADIRAIGGTPSWLLLFFNKMRELRPDITGDLGAWYPRLEMLVHGGINFAPYRDIFRDLLQSSQAETREVYPASEGFIALADRGDGEGLRLLLDNGLFFEFVPLEELNSANPTRHWVGSAERDVNYAIVLSTASGLWSYVIGDTVRFIDLSPPRVMITGRTSYSLSAFGEHLIGEEIEDAISTAAAAIDAGVSDFSVGPIFPTSDREKGGHLFIVEFGEGAPGASELETFSRVIDERLSTLNEDYSVHRDADFGMKPPIIHSVERGTFAAWMKKRGRLGGQNKVPRIINDDDLFGDLRRFTGAEN